MSARVSHRTRLIPTPTCTGETGAGNSPHPLITIKGNSHGFKSRLQRKYCPHIKFNARNGTWSFDGTDIKTPVFAIDLANLVTGWLRFQTGLPPSRRIDPDLQHMAPKPDDEHKRGFIVKIHSDELFNGAAEFSSASAHVGSAIDELHEQYLKECASHPGMVPVVRCITTVPVKDRHATNHRPVMVVTNWIERPRDLEDGPPVKREEIWKSAAHPVRPPLATPASAPFDDDMPF
jgi:hypothetical protein